MSSIWKSDLIQDSSDPRLHVKSKPIKNVQDTDTILLIQRMRTVLSEHPGIGLAAPQIGVSKRAILVVNEVTNEVLEFLNPRITDALQVDENINWNIEGCLSHPGIRGEVARYRSLTFVAQTLKYPQERGYTVKGLAARIIQHEIDHLNGILFPDLMAHGECRNIVFIEDEQKTLLEHTRINLEQGYKPVDETLDPVDFKREI